MTDFIQRYFKKDFDEYRRIYRAEIAKRVRAKDKEFAERSEAREREFAEAKALQLANVRNLYRRGQINLESAALLLNLPVPEAEALLGEGATDR